MKRQGIYWLVDSPNESHQSRAALLEELDFDVSFFSEIQELKKALLTKRVSIIFVGDELEKDVVLQAMDDLASMPDIQGARLLLSVSQENSEASFLAASNGFRDIIPLSLSNEEWISRFQFSIASNNDSNVLSSKSKKVQKKVQVAIPARIAWIGGEKIWIESKARPYLGDELDLSGSLASEMGSAHLQLKVLSQEQKNLAYRFSEANICSWEIDVNETESVEKVIGELKANNQGIKKKVFLAMQSPALRNAILKYLNPDIFDVHTALQKKSLVSEPKYFSPSLVFIEFRLFDGDSLGQFQDMVTHIPETSTIVMVGAKKDDLGRFHNFSLGRRIEPLFQIPKNLPDLIQNNYLKLHKDPKEQNIYIPRNHRYTLAEINLDSTLLRMEGDFFELRIPIGLANYGLIRLKLPSGDELFAKVVGSSTPKERDSDHKSHEHIITCHVNWLSKKQQESVIVSLK